MKLAVLGSGSKENCYLLQSSNETLIIECGVKFSEVQKALDYNIMNVCGCLVSHEHKDHAKYVKEYAERGVKVFASTGTMRAIELFNNNVILRELVEYHIGDFTVMPFACKHDAAEPFGYIIKHHEMGVLMFATDTYYLEYNFKGVNHIMIECNHDEGIINARLKAGEIAKGYYERLITSHMSLRTCCEMLQAMETSNVNTITLLHLSNDNANERNFVRMTQKVTGKVVYVAKKGVNIELFR